MLTVAVVSLALVVVVPVSTRLLWLYYAPLPSSLIAARLEPEWSGLAGVVPVGEPVAVRCPYELGLSPTIPAGLPYRVTAEVSLVDSTGATVESRGTSHLLVARWQSVKKVRGEILTDLTPPGPDCYTVRYEIHATDLFGRHGMCGCTTGGFEAC